MLCMPQWNSTNHIMKKAAKKIHYILQQLWQQTHLINATHLVLVLMVVLGIPGTIHWPQFLITASCMGNVLLLSHVWLKYDIDWNSRVDTLSIWIIKQYSNDKKLFLLSLILILIKTVDTPFLHAHKQTHKHSHTQTK